VSRLASPPMTDVVTVERFIPAPAPAIFELLTDPARHQEIDGSGTVRDPKTSTDRLVLGSEFGMSMKMGLPYSMVSTVIEYEPDRRIAWQTRGPGRIGQKAGGRVWRYEIEPREGGTLVRESWDIRDEAPVTRPVVRLSAKKTEANMIATLERIEDLLTT
jgi:uncharacterized protein YndB with AHSA1/START domain